MNSKQRLRSSAIIRAVRELTAILCIGALPGSAVAAPTQQAAPPAEQTAALIPADQLDSLVAPIALYPDPLLSQTLVASTYPLEVIQLQQWLAQHKDLKGMAKLVLEDRAGISESATAFRPDGRQLAVGHHDGTLRVHDTETGAVVRQWQVGVSPFAAMFHPHLPRVAVACGTEVRVYDVQSVRPPFPPVRQPQRRVGCRLEPRRQKAGDRLL